MIFIRGPTVLFSCVGLSGMGLAVYCSVLCWGLHLVLFGLPVKEAL